MCRLFAVFADAPLDLSREFNLLAAQAVEHRDGWGLATFDDGLFHETSLQPAHVCPRFGQRLETAMLRRGIVHLRLASIGPVSQPNAHPFVDRGWAFGHNGTLSGFERAHRILREALPPRLAQRIRGETDSEVCFYHFLDQLERQPPSPDAPALALGAALRAIYGILGDGDSVQSATNFVATDGHQLLLHRRGRTLFHRRIPEGHLVSSEALGADWSLIPEGEVWHFVSSNDLPRRRPV